MSSTAKLTVYRGRDNAAKFGVAYKDGDVVDLAGVTRALVEFAGVTFDSDTAPSSITWTDSRVFRGTTHLVLTVRLGNAAGLAGIADGVYTDGKVVLFDAAHLNGYEVDTRLTVTVR